MRYRTEPFVSLKIGDCFLLYDGTIAIKTHGYFNGANARNWHTDANLIVKGSAEVIPILLLGGKNNDEINLLGDIKRNREIYFIIKSLVVE